MTYPIGAALQDRFAESIMQTLIELAQYGKRIWGLNEGSTKSLAETAIAKTETFFQSLGIKTKLSEYTADYNGSAEKTSERFTERGWLGLGEHKTITPDDVKKIVEMSY